MAADAKGQVYFVDRGRGVWRIDTLGNLTLISDCNFHWLALDEDGQFLQLESQRFKRVSSDTSKPVVLMASDNPIAVGLDGCVYSAIDYYSPRIMRLSPDGRESFLVGGVRGHADGRGAAARFEDIQDLAIGPDSLLYVSQANAIRKITSAGAVTTILRDFGVPGAATDLPTAPRVRGIAVDARGVVYAAATRSRCVIRVDTSGKIATLLRSEPPWAPTGVAMAGNDVYVLEYDDPEAERSAGLRVRKVSEDGKVEVAAKLEKKEN